MESKHKPKTRVFGFDMIRVFACILVITVHFNAALCSYNNGHFLYSNEIIPNFYVGGKVYLGTLGVVLFFILSGASLFLSNRQKIEIGQFYEKRFLSIYAPKR